jgi:hypothetical protein
MNDGQAGGTWLENTPKYRIEIDGGDCVFWVSRFIIEVTKHGQNRTTLVRFDAMLDRYSLRTQSACGLWYGGINHSGRGGPVVKSRVS